MLEAYVQKEGADSVLARALPETHIIDLQELEVHKSNILTVQSASFTVRSFHRKTVKTSKRNLIACARPSEEAQIFGFSKLVSRTKAR